LAGGGVTRGVVNRGGILVRGHRGWPRAVVIKLKRKEGKWNHGTHAMVVGGLIKGGKTII